MLGKSVAALALTLALALPVQAQVVIGLPPDGGNCFPFGCASGDRYQQVYHASNWTGSFLINGISFFQTALTGGNLNSGTYDIFLSTTAKAVNGLSSTMDDNLGLDTQLFGSFVLAGGVATPTLSFSGAGFAYDPSQGNLLMDIRISGIGHSGPSAFHDARDGTATATQFSRMHNFGTGFEGRGLVTEFSTSRTGVVPEPMTVVLLGTGLVGVAAAARRRREGAGDTA